MLRESREVLWAGWSARWCLRLLGAALMKSHNVRGSSATGIYFS